jgi:hypothetical protein
MMRVQVQEQTQWLTVDELTASWHKTVQPNPEYQRGSKWRLEQQQLLIDSIFRGYPLPRFYFRMHQEKGVIGTHTETLEVIDGQQRIIAMAAYRSDHWPVPEPQKLRLPKSVKDQRVPWGGLSFSQLGDDLKRKFLDTKLAVVILDPTATDEEVRDLFIRLQAGTALTRQEVRDAWPGNIGPWMERLAGKLDRRPVYSLFDTVDRRGGGSRDSEDSEDRYLDGRQTCAQLLCLFLERRRTGDIPSLRSRVLDEMYHQYTAFDDRGGEAQLFEKLLSLTQEALRGRPYTSGGTKSKITKNTLFSLFLLIQDLDATGRFNVPLEIEKVRAALGEPSQLAPVGKSVDASTIRNHYWWFVTERLASVAFTGLDSRRLFDEQQKETLWSNSGGVCAVCSQPVDRGTEEYDHIVPWWSGGRTEVANGRVVHSRCHRRGRYAGSPLP